MRAIGIGELLVVLLVMGLIVLPYWKIFSKAGFSGWLCLTQVLPIINLVTLYYIAFTKWSVRQDLGGTTLPNG